MPMRRVAALLGFLLCLGFPTLVHAASSPELSRAQALLDQGQPTEALKIVEGVLKKDKKNAEALLMRSTARLMLGDEKEGVADLDRALDLDPTLRQGWLNRAALALADQNHEAALNALLEAQKLDPSADDNFLNIGAVRLLMGDLDEASRDFESYIQRNPRAESHYLVAKNYALAGYPGLAVRYLHQAIAMNERYRVHARADPNFAELAENPRFQELMFTDLYEPPPGSYRAGRAYSLEYRHGEGPLLQATLDALHALRLAYEPAIDITPDWALVWSRVRIKVSDTPNAEGQVAITAPPDAMSAAEFQELSKRLLDRILIEVGKRALRKDSR